MDANKALRLAYELMQKMEKEHATHGFQEEDLDELVGLLAKFGNHKIALIPHHLTPDMSLRHFLNFVVPVERQLAKSLSDEQFLVTSEDKDKKQSGVKAPLCFVLENLRSAFNVGSIFRLSDCLNVSHIYLVGYTPTPESDAVKKTSMGTTANTPWSAHDRLEDVVKILEEKSIGLVALETAKNSETLHQAKLERNLAYLVGNERFGLEEKALKACTKVISIPTFGAKNSLNVASALSIAAYEWKRQNP
jgi:23S rRNA (guanosine2251-2'-O)-methyltransferase